jgi:GH24 family phage-related lysozyme (muramidase)
MAQFDGKRVSRPWKRILTEARAHGVRFLLTSGRRTMAEQTRLWRNPPRDANGRPVPVAFPQPNAPHIWVGRPAHAIDVNALDGGETRLERWLENHGLNVENPVAGEAWHMVVTDGQIKELADRIKREHEKERDRVKRLNARKPPAHRKLSDDGLALIANFEGLRLEAYKPVPTEQFWTIGYGHYGPDVQPGMRITKARALELLKRDVKIAEGAVRSMVKAPLRQQEYDALVSLAYNIGNGAFGSSTLLRELNQKHYLRAANQFLRWNRGGGKVLLGLTRRRRAERSLFRSKRS